FTVRVASDGDEAARALEDVRPVAVLCDHLMPGMTGAAVLERAKARHPRAVRLLMTASEDVDDLVNAVNKGEIHRFFRKPLNAPEVVAAVTEAVERAREEALLRVELDSLAALRASAGPKGVRALVVEPARPGVARVRE